TMDRDPYQALLQKTFDRRIPFTAHCELTYRCNWSCVHCYLDPSDSRPELTVEQYDGIFKQLAGAGCLFLTFTGGEVFLRQDALDVFHCAQQYGFAMRLLTNGSLITPQLAPRLAELHFLRIDFSVHGAHAATHDRITRVPGSHDRALAALRACREAGLPVALKMILMKSNRDEFVPLRALAAGLGAEFIFDYVLIPSRDGGPTMAQHGLSEEEIRAFLMQHADASRLASGGGVDEGAPICGAGSNALAISPQGDVFPCLGYRDPVGNLLQQSFQEIWASPRLDRLHKARYYDYTECRGCRHESYCIRCPGITWSERGDAFRKSPLACMVSTAMDEACRRMK
ncbi:MAG: radical SAM protein, partial [Lentisphaerota bacterium]